ncbi:MAG: hypothetical protein ACJZ5D_05930 [Candidatus Thalassarchaeaceae archaeon]|tara:strand:+ start:3069 stop:3470 length:402 start_codon:yes stop_codon:yes gene_type:complete
MSEERLVRPLSLTLKGPGKAEESSLLKPKKERIVDITLPCVEITIQIERRIQRTVIRGGEGDDLLDEGSESAVYNVISSASVSEYQSMMELFRGGQPHILDPFDGREVKVAFKSIEYSASNGALKMVLIEDVD